MDAAAEKNRILMQNTRWKQNTNDYEKFLVFLEKKQKRGGFLLTQTFPLMMILS